MTSHSTRYTCNGPRHFLLCSTHMSSDQNLVCFFVYTGGYITLLNMDYNEAFYQLEFHGSCHDGCLLMCFSVASHSPPETFNGSGSDELRNVKLGDFDEDDIHDNSVLLHVPWRFFYEPLEVVD